MKFFVLLFALMALTVVGCNNSQAPTEPRTSSDPLLKAESIKDAPVFGFFYNECCGEEIIVEGTAHIVERGNGIHFNVTGLTGTGSSGNTYTGHNTSTSNITSNGGNGASNFSAVTTINMTNENGCSFKLMIHFHVTTNANGETTVVIDKYETQCE